jgi:hypothetical protein
MIEEWTSWEYRKEKNVHWCVQIRLSHIDLSTFHTILNIHNYSNKTQEMCFTMVNTLIDEQSYKFCDLISNQGDLYE